MKYVYMSVSITLFRRCEPDCYYCERLDGGEVTSRKLTLDEARRLQWELVKAGADREFRPNFFDNAVSQVDVRYWALR